MKTTDTCLLLALLDLSPAARHVLNSVFLGEAREHGLDAAIMNGGKIIPLHTLDEDDLKVGEIFRGALPFVLAMILSVLVIVMFPPIATWLARL